MRRAVMALRVATALVAASLVAVSLGLALPARGVLPPAYGGAVRLPLSAVLDDVDPARQAQPSGAAVAAALFDTLYALDAQGAPVPVLAESRPTPSDAQGGPPGTLVVTLRSALRLHEGQRLLAADVVASLRRAAAAPRAAWLLGAVATTANGALDLRATGALTLELRPARPGLDVARVLAARPLAIVVGDPHRRAVGTGPFSLRGTPGGATRDTVLWQHDPAALGAAYLERITLSPPRARDDEIRAFELAQTDASWFATTLYDAGRAHDDAAATRASAEAPAACPVLFVTSDTGALRDAGLRGYVAASIDRHRLERAGLSADATLAGLPLAAPPSARPPSARPTLRLAVPSGDPLLARVAEALAAMLDERGVGVMLVGAPPLDAPAPGTWDARLVGVVPPLPGAAALVGAALAAAGRSDAARALAPAVALADTAAATTAAGSAARTFDALVLGRRRETLYYRAALRDVRFDAVTGALDLAALWLPRTPLPVVLTGGRR